MATNLELQQKNIMAGVDPAAVAAAEAVRARIQAAYIVALNRPRSYDEARLRILKTCERPEFAAKVEILETGRRKIDQGSVDPLRRNGPA